MLCPRAAGHGRRRMVNGDAADQKLQRLCQMPSPNVVRSCAGCAARPRSTGSLTFLGPARDPAMGFGGWRTALSQLETTRCCRCLPPSPSSSRESVPVLSAAEIRTECNRDGHPFAAGLFGSCLLAPQSSFREDIRMMAGAYTELSIQRRFLELKRRGNAGSCRPLTGFGRASRNMRKCVGTRCVQLT
jgi:hypothetical protein